MKNDYKELVIRICLVTEKDVLTLSGETGSDSGEVAGPDGLIIDRGWGGLFE